MKSKALINGRVHEQIAPTYRRPQSSHLSPSPAKTPGEGILRYRSSVPIATPAAPRTVWFPPNSIAAPATPDAAHLPPPRLPIASQHPGRRPPQMPLFCPHSGSRRTTQRLVPGKLHCGSRRTKYRFGKSHPSPPPSLQPLGPRKTCQGVLAQTGAGHGSSASVRIWGCGLTSQGRGLTFYTGNQATQKCIPGTRQQHSQPKMFCFSLQPFTL